MKKHLKLLVFITFTIFLTIALSVFAKDNSPEKDCKLMQVTQGNSAKHITCKCCNDKEKHNITNCRFCGGSGYCSYCGGSTKNYDGTTCTYCDGTGSCWWCEGTGDDEYFSGDC